MNIKIGSHKIMNFFSWFLAICVITTVSCQNFSGFQKEKQPSIYVNCNTLVEKNWEICRSDKIKKEKAENIMEKMQQEKKKTKNSNEDLLKSKNSIFEALIFSLCSTTFKSNQDKIMYRFKKNDMVSKITNNLINLKDHLLFFCPKYILKDDVEMSNISNLKESKKDFFKSVQKSYEVRIIIERLTKQLKWFFFQVFRNRLKPSSIMQMMLQPDGRGRRGDHRMFAMLVMGFMIMASVLIPMGFQFLTVLGGKSLLIAKMALIISAISGLKKIATSNVGYGFYHTGSDVHHHGHHQGFHDKLYQIPTGPS